MFQPLFNNDDTIIAPELTIGLCGLSERQRIGGRLRWHLPIYPYPVQNVDHTVAVETNLLSLKFKQKTLEKFPFLSKRYKTLHFAAIVN
jgi:hypothetical protein